jgi:hypothetical protein
MGLDILGEALGVDLTGEFRINDVQFVQWGRDLIFGCEYRADETALPVPFRLLFSDCRELRWKTYAHAVYESPVIPSTTLVDFAPGHGNHRKDASLLTSHFAATVSYGDGSIELRDRRVKL